MKTILITGSSGFIGTNLTKKLLAEGNRVIGLDNFSSSEKWKSEIFKENVNYEFIEFDITGNLEEALNNSKLFKESRRINGIYNMACPASPPRYAALPLETIEVNTIGIRNLLELAKKYNAKMLHSSTSEIYGDPLVHPQIETYRGNVNTVGPRSCYDEGKRIAETICYEYKHLHDVDIRIIRIFNTYGPYMDPNDGRVITNFIIQALKGEDITVYGDGEQTRSFQYIDDLLEGIEKFMELNEKFMGPVNLGNPIEFTIKELADLVLKKINSNSKLVNKDLPKDDPSKRKPDITLAKTKLNWEPSIKLNDGLDETIKYYKYILGKDEECV